MLSAAMTMKKGIGFLTPLIRGDGSEYIGTAIIGMAEGDLHDIGKNLLAIMFESVGFKVIDLGIDVSPEAFSDALAKHPECKILAISATLVSTVSAIENTIQMLESSGAITEAKIYASKMIDNSCKKINVLYNNSNASLAIENLFTSLL